MFQHPHAQDSPPSFPRKVPARPTPHYPQTWNRIRAWLSKEYPELGDTLNFGILPHDFAQLEMTFGFHLPAPLHESYLCVDGQEPESSAGCSEGLFFGLTLLPLENVLQEWQFWREVDEDPNTGANDRLRSVMQSIPSGWVKQEYSSRGWIPLVADKAGNYLGVDMSPGEEGEVGQVIVFGRDFDTKVVMWRGDGPGGWAKWLAGFADDLESGDGYEMGSGSDGSDGSEDGIGYDNYFLGDGGESGGGGMRLSGEYRGWNVLEAWADKSVRRWQETGVVPNSDSPKEKGKEKARPPPTLNLPSGSAAEVPIPVLADDKTPTSQSRQQHPIPTISVTKPPVPLPVGLPTEDDIITPVDLEHRAAMSDIEAGIGDMMQEMEENSAAAHVSPPPMLSRSASNALREAAGVPLPASPGPRVANSPEPSASSIPNLLEDPAPILPTPPIVPSISTTPTPTDKAEAESPVLISTEDATESDPEPTVRIVGGAAGVPIPTGDESLSSDGVLVLTPTEENERDFSQVSLADVAASKKHEKKSSISLSLKKIGNLGGGKRKKGSVSSVKEVI
ncbi:hypothetical protein EUX98_g3031 [Antrodiella citrinella]|uniref:Knr4/Smi1-like domain-containing protein n=1 Tax=Antrodiella citrinella TaxID=2447956 RepID=A0A4S4MZQ0_9APHY|nr:hypothetical protein EUX98_g3031 [Antrodiella citrinella]